IIIQWQDYPSGRPLGRKINATNVGETRLDFLSKEPVTGELLSARLGRGPLPADVAVRYAIEIGAALHRIHSRGLVHGELSPFCIALAAGGARILEATASPADCAAYRAPEQICGDEPDERSDIFAFGALVYEITSGKRAFPDVGAELDRRILTEPPAPLLAKSAISAALEGVVAGCLEKDPAHRRQRVQNAVIELKLAGRALPRNRGDRFKPAGAPLAAPRPGRSAYGGASGAAAAAAAAAAAPAARRGPACSQAPRNPVSGSCHRHRRTRRTRRRALPGTPRPGEGRVPFAAACLADWGGSPGSGGNLSCRRAVPAPQTGAGGSQVLRDPTGKYQLSGNALDFARWPLSGFLGGGAGRQAHVVAAPPRCVARHPDPGFGRRLGAI